MEILGNMCLLKMIHAKINRYFKERPYAWKVLLYPIFTRSTKSCVCLAASILRSVLTAQWPCVCKRQKIGLWQSHCDACNASAGKTVIIFPKRKFQRKAERFQIWIESLSWCRRKPASASIQVDQVQASGWTKCKHPGGPSASIRVDQSSIFFSNWISPYCNLSNKNVEPSLCVGHN